MSTTQDVNMPRVQISRNIVGMAAMQVCAVNDATDEEILKACNEENPSGVEQGWCRVLRGTERPNCAPIPCAINPSRTHFLVEC